MNSYLVDKGLSFCVTIKDDKIFFRIYVKTKFIKDESLSISKYKKYDSRYK